MIVAFEEKRLVLHKNLKKRIVVCFKDLGFYDKVDSKNQQTQD